MKNRYTEQHSIVDTEFVKNNIGNHINSISKKIDFMHLCYEEKGITLVTLVVTIIVLLILSTVTITISVDQFDNIKLKGFYTKLETVQQGIEKIAETNESYIDSNNNTIYLRDLGEVPTEEQKNLIESLGYTSENFKFFTASQVEQELEITGVDLDLLIDFNTRNVISTQGIEADGKTYYTLENKKYTVDINENKNKGTVDFSYKAEKYGENSYKITIMPLNIGDIKQGTVKYKKENINYWTAAEDNQFITEQLAKYEVMYEDANNNSVTKTLLLSLNESGEIVVTEE